MSRVMYISNVQRNDNYYLLREHGPVRLAVLEYISMVWTFNFLSLKKVLLNP